jgi:ribosomal protein S18 acetylase RimI-like enzyme
VTDVRAVTSADDAVVNALNHLLPQLSSNATVLSFADVEEIVSSPWMTVLVAEDEGRVIGCLTLVVFRIPTGVRAWIEDVVVDRSARGRGVGEALTRAAVDEARRRGARTIDLTSRPSRDAANTLYGKVGFARRDTNVYRFLVEEPAGE